MNKLPTYEMAMSEHVPGRPAEVVGQLWTRPCDAHAGRDRSSSAPTAHDHLEAAHRPVTHVRQRRSQSAGNCPRM
jgi:hypothetical protein